MSRVCFPNERWVVCGGELSGADEGDAVREDTGCGVLYGVVRDSALKIKKLAELEKGAHIKKGWWKD